MAKRATKGQYHGYLVVEKPAGMTSHDVVSRIRKMTGERRVGHAGTLDPAAVGVLPVAVGLATRTVEYLSESSKSYLAEITFGVTTDSADGDGTVMSTADAQALTRDEILEVLPKFRGDILQVPPMHSAIKVGGTPLYELARKGEVLDLDARPVTIHALELVTWEPPSAEIFVHCSKGTYIRSLARDLGAALGVGAYMSNLIRLSTGPFTLEDSWQLDDLREAFESGSWEDVAAHPDASLLDRPAVVLSESLAALWRNGNSIPLDLPADLVRVYDVQGHWMGIGACNPESGTIQPEKVVVEAYEH